MEGEAWGLGLVEEWTGTGRSFDSWLVTRSWVDKLAKTNITPLFSERERVPIFAIYSESTGSPVAPNKKDAESRPAYENR